MVLAYAGFNNNKTKKMLKRISSIYTEDSQVKSEIPKEK